MMKDRINATAALLLAAALAFAESVTVTYDDSEKVLIDVKGLYNVEELKASGMQWWRL